MGYVSLRQPESHLVFQVISVRHDRRKPTVVTTNRTFGEWNQIFADDAVAHAILDRLAERAEVFHLEGTSYRETHRRPAPKVTPFVSGAPFPARAPRRACWRLQSPASTRPSASRRRVTVSIVALSVPSVPKSDGVDGGASTRSTTTRRSNRRLVAHVLLC